MLHFVFNFCVFLILFLFKKESNPEVMTTYISNLGVDTSEYRVCDVLALEEWALEMVPQPVLGFFFILWEKISSFFFFFDQFCLILYLYFVKFDNSCNYAFPNQGRIRSSQGGGENKN